MALLLMLLAPAPADAQLGQDGDPIESSDYTVDLYAGPVLGSARL